MKNLHLEPLVRQVCQIAEAAGAAIMDIYGAKSWQVAAKTDDSPVTSADLAANAIITEALSKLEPAFPFLSEETVHTPYEERRHFEYLWIIDPLDGTKEFIKGNGEFTVNIALVHQGRPVLGVVHVPAQGSTYYATKGQGAFKKMGEVVKRLTCATFRSSDKGLRIPISRSYLNEETQALLAPYDTPDLQSIGSSLKFLYLAEGLLDVYPRVGTTKEWDTAAPQIILEEAGGNLWQLGTNSPLVYNKPDLHNPNFLAQGKNLDTLSV